MCQQKNATNPKKATYIYRWVRESTFHQWPFWISKKLKPLSFSPGLQSLCQKCVLVQNFDLQIWLYWSATIPIPSLCNVNGSSAVLVLKTNVRSWDTEHRMNLSTWKFLLVIVSASCQTQCCNSWCVSWMLRLSFGTQNRQGCIKIKRIWAFWF